MQLIYENYNIIHHTYNDYKYSLEENRKSILFLMKKENKRERGNISHVIFYYF